MTDLIYLLVFAIFLFFVLGWGFRHLPGERWQMLAVVPSRKTGDQRWQGTNLTYYGFFLATSQLISLLLFLILLGSMGVSLPGTLLAASFVLAISVPSARVIAILVEKKLHTFTIGGAFFAGIVSAPFAIVAAEGILRGFIECYLPLMPTLAAMAIAYTLGEGLGRLGCLSFGCCYGKPLSECRPLVRKIFTKTATVFEGSIKKVEYECHLGGEPLFPVQTITCILFTITALGGCWLFLQEMFVTALVCCISTTQSWRLFSETLRADYRGSGKISAYQIMSVLAVLYTLALAALPATAPFTQPVVQEGLRQLWTPGIVIGLQCTWLIFFLFFGRSTVTTSSISFSLFKDRI